MIDKNTLKNHFKNYKVINFNYMKKLYNVEIFINNNILCNEIKLNDKGILIYKLCRFDIDDLLKDVNFSYTIK